MPPRQISRNPFFWTQEKSHISRQVTCQNLFKSVMLRFYRYLILASEMSKRGDHSPGGWCDLGSCSACHLWRAFHRLAAPVLNSVSTHPFLDLYFKWDQRSASGSCQWRLLRGPDLPCSCSPKWLWPSSGFPRSARCPYLSPQQGGDRARVSHHLERFSGYYPERLHPLVPQVLSGHLLCSRCSAGTADVVLC